MLPFPLSSSPIAADTEPWRLAPRERGSVAERMLAGRNRPYVRTLFNRVDVARLEVEAAERLTSIARAVLRKRVFLSPMVLSLPSWIY